MTNPIGTIREFYSNVVHPAYDRAVEIGGEIAKAGSDVGHALHDAGQEVGQAVSREGYSNVAADIVKSSVATDVTVLKELHARSKSPMDFVDWLAGPKGPSVESATARVPGLQSGIGHVIDAAMKNPLIAGVAGHLFSFEKVEGQDFYTTNESGLQSYAGFHAVMDKVGKLMGMDLQDKTMEFEANGVGYKVELWKGSYGAGGAYGGEIGIYTTGAGDRGPLGNLLEHIPGYYSSANGGNQIKTTQTITDTSSGKRFTNDGKGADGTDGKHFWNLAIRTDPGVRDEDIQQEGTLEFSGMEFNGHPDADKARNVAESLFAQMQKQDVPGVALSADHLTISYTWGAGPP